MLRDAQQHAELTQHWDWGRSWQLSPLPGGLWPGLFLPRPTRLQLPEGDSMLGAPHHLRPQPEVLRQADDPSARGGRCLLPQADVHTGPLPGRPSRPS